MNVAIILSTLTTFYGASPSPNAVRFNYVHAEATMPVVVRGNVGSKVLVLFLHGGPGGSAQLKIGLEAFNQLESLYEVVYWDQRGSGESRGGVNRRFMNLTQYVQDLDGLVDELMIRYPGKSLFLLGHSWGGCLATAYLADANRAAKIAGWINAAGAYNNPRGDSLSAEWIIQHSENMIAAHQRRSRWRRALKWYSRHPDFTSEEIKHYRFVKKAHGYSITPKGDAPGYSFWDFVRTPRKVIRYYVNYKRTLNRFIISEIDLSSVLAELTLPTLIIWGKDDGVIPDALATEAYSLLGTPDTSKRLHLMPQAAHMLFFDQPEKFSAAVTNFINAVERSKDQF